MSEGAGSTSTSTTTARSRILGCFLGGAVGDALGAPVEFMSLDQIRVLVGPRGVEGYWERADCSGAFTDDTQMTLFTAEGLIRAHQRWRERGIANHVVTTWSAYLRWLETQGIAPFQPGSEYSGRGFLVDVPELRKRRAPGNTCLNALRTGQMGAPESPLNDSKGCGGVMRVAPAGFVGRDPFESGVRLAAITHGHPSGYLAAGALAQIVAEISAGKELEQAVGSMIERLEKDRNAIEVRMSLEAALEMSHSGTEPSARIVEALGAGWVAEEALAIAIYCALVAGNFRHGVVLAVNHSGDSDSTGSISGQLLGTLLGVEAIPPDWLQGLCERQIVERLANDFADSFLSRRDLSYQDYPPN